MTGTIGISLSLLLTLALGISASESPSCDVLLNTESIPTDRANQTFTADVPTTCQTGTIHWVNVVANDTLELTIARETDMFEVCFQKGYDFTHHELEVLHDLTDGRNLQLMIPSFGTGDVCVPTTKGEVKVVLEEQGPARIASMTYFVEPNVPYVDDGVVE